MNVVHGGDLDAIGRAFGVDASRLLDFSANINPAGPPDGVVAVLREAVANPRLLAAYPDPQARALTGAIAAREGIAPERIVVGNGGAALLDAAVRALRPRRCLLPVPTFSEYARALAAAEVATVTHPLQARDDFALDVERLVAAARSCGADLCILASPHNPSGALMPRAEALAAVHSLAALGCAVIVDEAFIDYVPEESIASALGDDAPVVVLRSLTKFYAIPGLRVGYAFAPPVLATRLRATLPSWPVGTLEQRAACAALADDGYAAHACAANLRERTRLEHALRELGAAVFPAAANFVLFDACRIDADAERLRARAIREHGIVVRTFPDDPALGEGSYVRVAVRDAADNARLVAALAAIASARDGV